MEKTVEYYLGLPYTVELIPEPAGGWFVGVKELPGCISEGDTPEQAIEMIRDAMRGWIEVSLEDSDSIPEPRELDDYSGKFVVRVPRSLHRDMVDSAEREGVSLNQYVSVALARSVGRPAAASQEPTEEPCWSMLNSAVCRALAAAGLTEQLGELDEQLFADHLARLLSQVRSALDGGYFQKAERAVTALASGLQPAAHKSPVLSVFLEAVELLHEQVALTGQVRRGMIIDEYMLRSRITEAVQGAMVSLLVTKGASRRYSTASLEPPLTEKRTPTTELLQSLALTVAKRSATSD